MVHSAVSEVESRARQALAASPIYAIRELRVEERDGCLHISGRVDTFYHKQVAQEVVRAVAEDLQVVNSILVN